ncbi:MAG: carboxypeptidase-like regulatory domain-containing protein [Candidatus Wallbacteria bacterium]|nr:carboxypeptidase-like regulatory domain-containing protein [Candidatus Wallbacteria bacterium]
MTICNRAFVICLVVLAAIPAKAVPIESLIFDWFHEYSVLVGLTKLSADGDPLFVDAAALQTRSVNRMTGQVVNLALNDPYFAPYFSAFLTRHPDHVFLLLLAEVREAIQVKLLTGEPGRYRERLSYLDPLVTPVWNRGEVLFDYFGLIECKGQPVSGVLTELYINGEFIAHCISDPAGHIAFQAINSENFQLRLSCDGFFMKTKTVYNFGHSNIDDDRIEIIRRIPWTLSGRVSCRLQPVAGVTVLLKNGSDSDFSSVTDEDGYYSLSPLYARECTIRVTCDGYHGSVIWKANPAQADLTLDIELRKQSL